MSQFLVFTLTEKYDVNNTSNLEKLFIPIAKVNDKFNSDGFFEEYQNTLLQNNNSSIIENIEIKVENEISKKLVTLHHTNISNFKNNLFFKLLEQVIKKYNGCKNLYNNSCFLLMGTKITKTTYIINNLKIISDVFNNYDDLYLSGHSCILTKSTASNNRIVKCLKSYNLIANIAEAHKEGKKNYTGIPGNTLHTTIVTLSPLINSYIIRLLDNYLNNNNNKDVILIDSTNNILMSPPYSKLDNLQDYKYNNKKYKYEVLGNYNSVIISSDFVRYVKGDINNNISNFINYDENLYYMPGNFVPHISISQITASPLKNFMDGNIDKLLNDKTIKNVILTSGNPNKDKTYKCYIKWKLDNMSDIGKCDNTTIPQPQPTMPNPKPQPTTPPSNPTHAFGAIYQETDGKPKFTNIPSGYDPNQDYGAACVIEHQKMRFAELWDIVEETIKYNNNNPSMNPRKVEIIIPNMDKPTPNQNKTGDIPGKNNYKGIDANDKTNITKTFYDNTNKKQYYQHLLGTAIAMNTWFNKHGEDYIKMMENISNLVNAFVDNFKNKNNNITIRFGLVGQTESGFDTTTKTLKITLWGANESNWNYKFGYFAKNFGGGQANFYNTQTYGVFGISTMPITTTGDCHKLLVKSNTNHLDAFK
jgi:hypothetical protein